jgi:hypothetical protein
MRTFMTQKSNFRTLLANLCQAFQNTCNGAEVPTKEMAPTQKFVLTPRK